MQSNTAFPMLSSKKISPTQVNHQFFNNIL